MILNPTYQIDHRIFLKYIVMFLNIYLKKLNMPVKTNKKLDN